ncbi:Outer membrane protein assembly factor BamA precursor [Pseudobythopirellula maris]|uniref:Outer membrane protein assembly factor BamA n=1 Tax=Pseudobythopirellula maris TaxID=2527991 RepID=A0A5C5ZLS5_9BACT|nr:POTRA domain-containing protein [Pseudobythopirellula maris]TWT88402.1 Outer membrane protein assembly factor BamA precursor [Pseudobythopirellula maris]
MPSLPLVRSPLPRSLAAAFAVVLTVSAACGQGFSTPGGAPDPSVGAPPGPKKSVAAGAGLSAFATNELVTEIRVEGNRTVPASRITAQMQTRVGRPFDPKALQADVRKLGQLPYFAGVRPLTERTAEGRVVILRVAERATIRYVEYLGNERIKAKKLARETGVEVGGAVDPYAVEEGRRKLLELYKSNGFGRAEVTIAEGSKPDDRGVVYVIHEGDKQRIWSVEFEGNEFASDGQLKTKVKAKPGFAHLMGGKFNQDQLDDDRNRIIAYYRKFGFFRATVGRTIEFGESGEWATITYVINEGPRYQVRNVSLVGNEKFADESLLSGATLPAGEPFEQDKMNADVNWLKDLYGSKGYVFADVKAEPVFLEEPGKIDLVYRIEEGERFRVGKIIVNIGGENPHTRIQTALNRFSIRPGDVVDTRELRATERRISSSSLFNTNPQAGATPRITYQLPELTEQQLADESASASGSAKRHTTYQGWTSVYGQDGGVTSTPVVGGQGGVVQAGGPGAATTGAAQPVQQVQYQGQTYPTPAAQNVPTLPGSPAPYQPGTRDPVLPPQPVRQESPFPPSTPYPAQTAAPAPDFPPYQAAPEAAYNPTTPYSHTAQSAYSQGSSYPARGYQGPAPTYGGALGSPFLPGPVYAPTPVPPPNDPAVDLYVNLEETQTGRFMLGVGVNSDAGVVGQILLDERNFDWRRPPTSFQDIYDGTAFRGGGQRFRLEAAPGTQVQRYVASWQEPYLWDTPISLSLSGNYYDRRYDDWDEQRLGGRIGLGYQWTDNDLAASLTYRGENVNIHDISTLPGVLPQYDEMVGDNALHGFGMKIINDTRDNPFLATSGHYAALTLEAVTGSFDYPRAEVDLREYFLIRERPDHTGRHVLVWQTRLGFTGSNTPSYDRFYAGGFSTMRGFDFRGASPTKNDGTNEVGGDFMWLNTLEYMFPLTADDMINGVVFCDYGTVNESVELDNFRIAPGVGLRLTIPAMGPAPIALDFAFPVESSRFDDEQTFTFNVGFMR